MLVNSGQKKKKIEGEKLKIKITRVVYVDLWSLYFN